MAVGWVLLTSLLISNRALPAWPITEFEVFLGEPWHTNETLLVEGGRWLEHLIGPLETESSSGQRIHISEATIDEIERYLGEVARRYSAMGFPPPMLEPVLKRSDGSKAYLVYLYDFDLDTPANYSTDCFGGALRRLIRIDSIHDPIGATITPNLSGQITNKGYQDLAHELFHAVQASFPLILKHCDLGDWIIEGTAQAIGVDMARELRGVDPINDPGRWGLRAYDKPLWIADKNPPDPDAYGSASFWRYIGEKVALAGGIPDVEFVAPDYRYLIDFFDNGLSGKEGEATELEWIDSQLLGLEEVGMGLSRVYPYFVSTYAGYINHRLHPVKLDSLAARTEWLGRSFGHCPFLEASANGAPASYRVKLGRVSSGCWLLGSGIQAALAVQVTASGASAEQLAALAVGTHNGQVVDKPDIVTIGEEELAHWLFRVDNIPGQQTVFVISNVAEIPGDTRELNLEINVTISGWDSTLEASR